jgi:hypothetical protein
VSREIQLRPPETSIARPARDEIVELISRLAPRKVALTGALELSLAGGAGRVIRLVLEGGVDGIELIRVLAPEEGSDEAERLCAGLGRELGWSHLHPARGRWRGPGPVSPAARRLRQTSLIRSGLMVLCACVVFVGVVIWHAGDRRETAWLGVIGGAVGLYFALRVWGFLDRMRSRERRP